MAKRGQLWQMANVCRRWPNGQNGQYQRNDDMQSFILGPTKTPHWEMTIRAWSCAAFSGGGGCAHVPHPGLRSEVFHPDRPHLSRGPTASPLPTTPFFSTSSSSSSHPGGVVADPPLIAFFRREAPPATEVKPFIPDQMLQLLPKPGRQRRASHSSPLQPLFLASIPLLGPTKWRFR